MTAAKPPRGSAPPGSHWCYNIWDFNALGTIYEKATGRTAAPFYANLLPDDQGREHSLIWSRGRRDRD